MAFFTSDMTKQWGDDWNDFPYIDNASYPYDEDTDIFILIFERYLYDYNETEAFDFITDEKHSVDDINNGAAAWLYDRTSHTAIQAGITLSEFVEKLKDKIPLYAPINDLTKKKKK